MSDDPPPELRRVYRATIAALPPVTRKVFLLHRAEGLPAAQIAARLDLQHETVAAHIASALITLDRALSDAGF